MTMDSPVEVHPKVWGEEHWIANREFCGKKLILKRGYRCSVHYHKNKDETFFVVSGLVAMEVEGQLRFMRPGEKQDIHPGTRHRFIGLADSVIMEFSTRHEEDDSYRDEPSGRLSDNELSDLLLRANAE